MKCPACGVGVDRDALFCARCGARVTNRVDRRTSNFEGARQRHVDEYASGRLAGDYEDVLWEGTYSWKGLIQEVAIGGLLSAGLLYMGIVAMNPHFHSLAFPLIAVIWLGLLGWLMYRKLNVWYTLTNQRLIHKRGILYRRTNRIEAIDIDDLRYEQGLIERFLGVGRILVRSSDPTHPALVMDGIDHVRHVFEEIDQARRRERLKHGLHIETV